MAPGDGVIARLLFQMWDATAARASAGAVGPHGGITMQPGFLEAWWLGSQGGWRSPESELGEGSQYKLMLYTWMPSREGVLEGDMWSLGMQLLVEILSHRLEALGSIPSTDEPGLGGHVCNSSTRGCRQENPKLQLYSEFYATLGYKMLSQKKRGRQS